MDVVPPKPIMSVMRWLANGVSLACLKCVLLRWSIWFSTSVGSTIDLNVVVGFLGSSIGFSGTIIMLLPLDMDGRAEGTRRYISFAA